MDVPDSEMNFIVITVHAVLHVVRDNTDAPSIFVVSMVRVVHHRHSGRTSNFVVGNGMCNTISSQTFGTHKYDIIACMVYAVSHQKHYKCRSYESEVRGTCLFNPTNLPAKVIHQV
jgi:hypothetical protein